MLDATEEPTVPTRVLNGVAVPSTEPQEERDFYPNHENTVVSAFRRHVQRGDHVVVVGGGWGTTTVVGARMTHFEGAVTTFEPSSRMLEMIQRTATVNRVNDVVTVEHAAIGSVSDASKRIFGRADGERLSLADIPECDVLDLDCEGTELEILRELEFCPRLLTVEAHPHFGCSHDAVEAQLADRGYEIVEKAPIEEESDIVNFVALQNSS